MDDVSGDFSRWPECYEHAYFQRKGLSVPRHLRTPGRDGIARVPVFVPDGRMESWQTISGSGDTYFFEGALLKSGWFFKFSEDVEYKTFVADGVAKRKWFLRLGAEPGDRIYIAEDMIEAASVYEAAARKFAVFCAFEKSNMAAVAEWLLKISPDKQIVLCVKNEGDKPLPPFLKHKRALALCPFEPGSFNDHLYNTETDHPNAEAEKRRLAGLADLDIEVRKAHFLFIAGLFEDKETLKTREILKKATDKATIGGLDLSDATAERLIYTLKEIYFLKKIGHGKYTATKKFKNWARRERRESAKTAPEAD